MTNTAIPGFRVTCTSTPVKTMVGLAPLENRDLKGPLDHRDLKGPLDHRDLKGPLDQRGLKGLPAVLGLREKLDLQVNKSICIFTGHGGFSQA